MSSSIMGTLVYWGSVSLLTGACLPQGWCLLNVRFYYYSGQVTGDNRSGDDCPWKDKSVMHRSQEEKTHHPMEATWGSTRAGQEAERAGENVGKSLLCGFQRKEWAGQGKQV